MFRTLRVRLKQFSRRLETSCHRGPRSPSAAARTTTRSPNSARAATSALGECRPRRREVFPSAARAASAALGECAPRWHKVFPSAARGASAALGECGHDGTKIFRRPPEPLRPHSESADHFGCRHDPERPPWAFGAASPAPGARGPLEKSRLRLGGPGLIHSSQSPARHRCLAPADAFSCDCRPPRPHDVFFGTPREKFASRSSRSAPQSRSRMISDPGQRSTNPFAGEGAASPYPPASH